MEPHGVLEGFVPNKEGGTWDQHCSSDLHTHYLPGSTKCNYAETNITLTKSGLQPFLKSTAHLYNFEVNVTFSQQQRLIKYMISSYIRIKVLNPVSGVHFKNVSYRITNIKLRLKKINHLMANILIGVTPYFILLFAHLSVFLFGVIFFRIQWRTLTVMEGSNESR